MYGNVLGAGLVAAPATLAFTGVGGTVLTVTVSVAASGIAVGIMLLRTSRISLFDPPAFETTPDILR